MFFVTAFEEMVMAGAFASWYWTMDKKNLPAAPLTSSLWRTVRYHLGTLAFGSLIIAIIRFIRLCIEYVEAKLKEYKQDNALVKVCKTRLAQSAVKIWRLIFDFSAFSVVAGAVSGVWRSL